MEDGACLALMDNALKEFFRTGASNALDDRVRPVYTQPLGQIVIPDVVAGVFA